MTYELVIFDFDGVLADSTAWMLGALARLAPAHGFRAPTAADVARLRVLPARRAMAEMGVSGWRLPRIARDLRRLAEAEAAAIALFPGIPEAIDGLHARGGRLAVVSSNSEVAVRAVLGARAGTFGHFACGASLFGKAAKLRAVVRSQDCAPGRAIYVGDEARDIAAARAAAIGAGAVAWGYGHPDHLATLRPDRIFARPADLGALL